MAVIVTHKRFNAGAELEKLTQNTTDTGAIVTFTGLCRGEKGQLTHLTLECYEEMAQQELEAIEAEARVRWPLQTVLIIHRHGQMQVGDEIVFVATTSAHRAAAFAAADFLMDFLKTRAPFWKLEQRGKKTSWVEATQKDDDATKRWL